ncbi:MAG: family 16 glycosylhydrolase [Bacteroidales bacterium]|nr:family 16 glycosylhydrolase [Bacteroidales bacterium]
MKKARFLLFSAAAVILTASATWVSGQQNILLWEDDFDNEGINTSNWNAETDNSGGGNDELQYYTPRDTNVYINNGKLIIKAMEEAYEGLSYTSGKLTTKGHADWRFGRIESSIKMPAGQGIWPAFWMLPTENKYGGWPNSGEIDIVEMVGHDTNTVYGTLHYGPPWNFTNGLYDLENGYFSDDFHEFAIEWHADAMKWFVDDELYSFKTADSLSSPEQWEIFHERFYVILNLAVGGNWPGDPDETTIFPQTMEIDYVRVYGDPGQQEIIAIDSAYSKAESVTYSFTNIPGATFQWTVPEGATIVEGQGTNSVEVNWGCLPGEIILNVSNIDADDQQYSLDVQFSELKIEGEEQLFPLSEITFTVPSLSGTNYDWTYPSDAVELSSPGNQLHLKWGCSAGSVHLYASNECASYTDSVSVQLIDPGIYGPSTVSENSHNMRYTVDPVPESSFEWSVPSDAVIASGQGTDSIAVDFGTEAGNISVEINNVCYTEVLELQIKITDTIILADYESTFPVFEVFANTTFDIVPNPDPDDINPSENVGESLKSEVAWAGIYTDLGYNLDMTRHKKFHLKVLGPKAGEVLLKLEDIDVGTVQFQEVFASYSTPDDWQMLEFIFPDAPTDVYDRITIFFDFGSEDVNTYYFDDLTVLPYEDTSAGKKDIASRVHIYPNPVSNKLFIKTLYDNELLAKVYDLQGTRLKEYTLNNNFSFIDVTDLNKGAYILLLLFDEKQSVSLFIKE